MKKKSKKVTKKPHDSEVIVNHLYPAIQKLRKLKYPDDYIAYIMFNVSSGMLKGILCSKHYKQILKEAGK